MQRAKQWIDRSQQRKDSFSEIMRENAQTVNVYRQKPAGDDEAVGFSKEADSEVLVRPILVRMDGARQRTPGPNKDNKQTPADITALTEEVDVMLGDMWRANDLAGQLRFYLVVRVVPNEAGCAVWLTEMRRDLWPD